MECAYKYSWHRKESASRNISERTFDHYVANDLDWTIIEDWEWENSIFYSIEYDYYTVSDRLQIQWWRKPSYKSKNKYGNV